MKKRSISTIFKYVKDSPVEISISSFRPSFLLQEFAKGRMLGTSKAHHEPQTPMVPAFLECVVY